MSTYCTVRGVCGNLPFGPRSARVLPDHQKTPTEYYFEELVQQDLIAQDGSKGPCETARDLDWGLDSDSSSWFSSYNW